MIRTCTGLCQQRRLRPSTRFCDCIRYLMHTMLSSASSPTLLALSILYLCLHISHSIYCTISNYVKIDLFLTLSLYLYFCLYFYICIFLLFLYLYIYLQLYLCEPISPLYISTHNCIHQEHFQSTAGCAYSLSPVRPGDKEPKFLYFDRVRTVAECAESCFARRCSSAQYIADRSLVSVGIVYGG